MKKFLIFSLFLCLFQCKKEEIKPSSNIVLYNQPLSVIKANIIGSWQLCFTKGGYCAVCPPVKNGYIFYDFFKNDRVIYRDTSFIFADTTINWAYLRDTFGDNTYILTFFDKASFPHNYIIDRILNDTLLIMDNSFDYTTYYLIRSY
jgi:hypothetical protein